MSGMPGFSVRPGKQRHHISAGVLPWTAECHRLMPIAKLSFVPTAARSKVGQQHTCYYDTRPTRVLPVSSRQRVCSIALVP